MSQTLKVVELFAGVGGFRLGLEGWKHFSASSGYKKRIAPRFDVIWSNQWEPSTKRQHASEVYEAKFGKEGHTNQDISSVDVESIPDHDLLVGGFPCQDYSVAATLNRSGGIQGKKGVLWWQIYRILHEKGAKRPRFLFLENVDRLLKSPAKQRGRDFAIMLSSLSDLGYTVEWRVVNAADYGMPQRRRRVFIIGYQSGSLPYKAAKKDRPFDWLTESGIMAKAFPVSAEPGALNEFTIEGGLDEISSSFGKRPGCVFENSGMIHDRKVCTLRTNVRYSGISVSLQDILLKDEAPKSYFIAPKDLLKWKYLKGAKSYQRISRDGFEYKFSEGGLSFPDPLDRPCRTIITGEGGSAPSRFKHVITDPKNGKLRRLTPVELERANMFPDDHTEMEGTISDQKRAFFMGNALVVGVIEKIGEELYKAAIKPSLVNSKLKPARQIDEKIKTAVTRS